MMHDAKCKARHMGPWLIELGWLYHTIAGIRSGVIQPMSAEPDIDADLAYSVDESGVVAVPITGQLMKGWSKYGGTSSLTLRQKLRMLKRDPEVKAVMLAIDSPGGTTAGTAELAEDVRELAQEKPVHAYIEDLGASAAYWVASQAHRITANATGEVGSIGTVAVLVDSSEQAAAEGIEVHVLSTGAYKGTGVPGTKVTPAQVEYLQSRVDDINEHFIAAVSDGRLVSRDRVREWADGRVWIAQKAAEKGLIDGVSTFEAAVRELRAAIPEPKPSRVERVRLRARMTKLAIDLAHRTVYKLKS